MMRKFILKQRSFNIFTICQHFASSCEPCTDNVTKHMYLRATFKSHQDVASYLKDNILFNRNGIIAVNKPYALKRYTDDETASGRKKNITAASPSMSVADHVSLQQTLPYLATELGVEKLVVVKSPERYCSGVCVLATSVELKDKLIKLFTDDKKPHYNFAAICVGIPSVKEFKCKLGLTVKQNKLQSGSKKACLVEDWSKNSVLRGSVKQVKVHHKTISCTEDQTASLVQVLINRCGNHVVRVYLASRILAPLIGDNIYGSIVQTVAGIPVLVNMWNPVASQPQKLSKSLREKLQLGPLKNSVVPVHLHLTQIKLPRADDKCKDIVITANPDGHFMWTCEKLGLDMKTFDYNMFDNTNNYDNFAAGKNAQTTHDDRRCILGGENNIIYGDNGEAAGIATQSIVR